jgi:hypothetical protein
VLLRLAVASLVAASAAAAGLAAPPGAPSPGPNAGRDEVTITVLFMCEGRRSVDPWEAHADPGDDIDWVLDPASDAERIRIRPKRAEGWPLGGGNPEGGKGARARGKVKGDAAKGRSSYDIEARCGNEWKRIDPDIIID